jgi:hypothetical protein
MAQVLNIGADNAAASTFLEPYVQSGTLNFLIGSGASSPAIKTAGDIETEINALLTANNEPQANRKCLDFIDTIAGVHAKIIARTDATVQAVADGYSEFLSVVDAVLFARKNIFLPRQASIFTTNYDMFLEHVAKAIRSRWEPADLPSVFSRSKAFHGTKWAQNVLSPVDNKV